MGFALMFALLVLPVRDSSEQKSEAVSLSGKKLFAPVLDEGRRAKLQEDLRLAQEAYDRDPTSVENAVWVGRRIAYLGRFQDSIEWYSKAIARFGPRAELLRHRGHRYLTVRKFDDAIKDFERASELIKGSKDEVEQDGVPNAKNQPISSLHSNIWYHLALARYLKGDFSKALGACEEGMKVSGNPDRLVSQTYWRYLILRKLGRSEEANAALSPISVRLELLENQAYLRLLLVFKGELSATEAMAKAADGNDVPTTAFGIGAWHLANGQKAKAIEFFEKAVSGSNWPAFGFIAAEVELHRGP